MDDGDVVDAELVCECGRHIMAQIRWTDGSSDDVCDECYLFVIDTLEELAEIIVRDERGQRRRG